mgnify:CR=1 FL=1
MCLAPRGCMSSRARGKRRISSPRLTIGSAAISIPGAGICLKRNGISIDTHDAVKHAAGIDKGLFHSIDPVIAARCLFASLEPFILSAMREVNAPIGFETTAPAVAASILDGQDPAQVVITNFMPERVMLNRQVLKRMRDPWRFPDDFAIVLHCEEHGFGGHKL